MSVVLKETAPRHFSVEGELTFATVMPLWRKTQPLLARASGKVIIDLQGVTRADSAALGLLVEWLRLGAKRDLSLSFQRPPPHLITMASAYNLTPLLPIHG